MAVYTTIDDAGSFYSTKLYTGTGSSLAVTGVGFSADFTWIKERDGTNAHNAFDTVRGAGELLKPNATNGESTTTEGLKSWESDGFTLGTNTSLNGSGQTFVAWNWKAGTTTGIAGSPSITPTAYSFNQTCGFSVIAYTGNATAGATLPHGLGVAPKMIILKRLDTTSDWQVYHDSMDATAPEDFYQVLDTTVARVDSTIVWNDTAPTSTLFSLGTTTNVNGNTNTYVAYCFADVQGFSKMGSYEGNGNASGTFVYTGFRPGRFMLKSTTSTQGWLIVDDKRVGYNTDNKKVYADSTEADTIKTNSLLANGWKITETSDTYNTSGVTYIYMAFAEAPLVNSSGVPGNAR